MSQIPPLAASIAQTALQQSQASKKTDAEQQKAGRFAQKMREREEEGLETVEDSYEATDEVVKVDEEEQETARDPKDPRDAYKPNDEDGGHLDVTV